jgi:hypothetical protein
MCRKLGWFGLAILLLAALAFPVLAEGGARLTEQGEMATQQLDLLTVPVMEGEGWKSADVAGYALYREKHADGCIYIQEMEKPEELGYTAGKDICHGKEDLPLHELQGLCEDVVPSCGRESPAAPCVGYTRIHTRERDNDTHESERI